MSWTASRLFARPLSRAFFALVVVALCSGACAPTAIEDTPASTDATDERPYLLERVDDAAVVQLYADGFAALPLRQKALIYHLYGAAIAGRDRP